MRLSQERALCLCCAVYSWSNRKSLVGLACSRFYRCDIVGVLVVSLATAQSFGNFGGDGSCPAIPAELSGCGLVSTRLLMAVASDVIPSIAPTSLQRVTE
jgi:hypothetical protein